MSAFDSTIRLRQANQPEFSGYTVQIIQNYLSGNPPIPSTGVLSGVFYPLVTNPSGFVTSSQTGVFKTQTDLNSLYTQILYYVGENYYPDSNPSGYINSANISGISGNLNNIVYTTGNQTISGIKTFATGINVNGDITINSNYLRGINSSNYIQLDDGGENLNLRSFNDINISTDSAGEGGIYFNLWDNDASYFFNYNGDFGNATSPANAKNWIGYDYFLAGTTQTNNNGNSWVCANFGNFGIGNSSPQYKLDVYGNLHTLNEIVAGGDIIAGGNIIGSGNTTLDLINVNRIVGPNASQLSIDNVSSASATFMTGVSNAPWAYKATGANYLFKIYAYKYANDNTRVYSASSYNLSINPGTSQQSGWFDIEINPVNNAAGYKVVVTDPTFGATGNYYLDVNNTSIYLGTIDPGSYPPGYYVPPGYDYFNNTSYQSQSPMIVSPSFLYYSTGNLQFYSKNLYFKDSKFGINTYSPQYLLDVNGSGNFRSGLYVSGIAVLTGVPPVTVTNAVYTTGNQSISGIKTFLTGMIVSGSLIQGNGNIASGLYSHAEGSATIASGQYSHAEGGTTITKGPYSHAEGVYSIASGYGSHAEGFTTISSGAYSHAEGWLAISSGDYSHAEGYGTFSVGFASHAEGSNNYSRGATSHAEGGGTTAFGQSSHSEGTYTYASGVSSHAEGNNTFAIGQNSHSEGISTTANGSVSHAEGDSTEANGYGSHAEGISTVANGNSSHSEGGYNFANGEESHAEGDSNFAVGFASHAEGSYTYANGDYSHSEGSFTQANGTQSHSEGYSTYAYKDESHSEGFVTTASGLYSHAEGIYTITIGAGSHAEGISTIASGNYQHVGGKFNTPDITSLLIIGNGTGTSARSNILTVDSNGLNVYGSGNFTGGLYINGIPVSTGGSSSSAAGVSQLNTLTGNLSIIGVSGVSVYISGTNGIIVSGNFNTGSFVTTGQTGNFVTTSQTGVFATSANLISTGSNLQGQISSLSGTLTGNYVLTTTATGISGTLTTSIASTGSNLQGQINSLSGKVVFITGNQTISGIKTFAGTGIFNNSVGIGTATPVYPLHIQTPGVGGIFGAYPTIALLGNSKNANIHINGDGSVGSRNAASLTLAARAQDESGPYGYYLGTDNDGKFRISQMTTVDEAGYTAAKDAGVAGSLTLDTAGNLGIGNTSPAYTLDVNGAIGTSNLVGGGSYLNFNDSTTDQYGKTPTLKFNILNSIIFDAGQDAGYGDIILNTSSSSNKRVGIGTASPEQTLHIYGAVLIEGNTTPRIYAKSNDGGNSLVFNRYGGQESYALYFGEMADTGPDIFRTQGGIYFGCQPDDSSQKGLFVSAATAGNDRKIGVNFTGNAALNYTLDVNGSGNFRSGLYVSGISVLTGSTSSFATSANLILTGSNLQSQITSLSGQVVYTTGNQTISGVKAFISRPTVNGTGVLLSGEASAATVSNVVYTTGNTTQTISGNLTVTGHFSANTKSFLIDHPTQVGKKLQYGVLEGPEHSVYLRGKTNNSFIQFPNYWSGLVDQNSITVSLTPIGNYQKLFVEEVNISGVKVGKNYFEDINYYYHIFAERKDVPKLEVEI
jgi:hypothetical protein